MQQQTCYEQQQGRPALILTSSQLNIICCLPALSGSILTVLTCVEWVYSDSAYLSWLGLYWQCLPELTGSILTVLTCIKWVYTDSVYLHWVIYTDSAFLRWWVYTDSAYLRWLGLYQQCLPALSGSILTVFTCVEWVFNTQQWILVAVLNLSCLTIVLSEIRATVADPDTCAEVVELAAIQLQETDEMVTSVCLVFITIHLSITQHIVSSMYTVAQ